MDVCKICRQSSIRILKFVIKYQVIISIIRPFVDLKRSFSICVLQFLEMSALKQIFMNSHARQGECLDFISLGGVSSRRIMDQGCAVREDPVDS